MTLTKEEIKNRAEKIDWWFTMDLGHGIFTKGMQIGYGDNTGIWDKLKIPDSCLKGKTVLDIGAWDGLYSFLAEKAGAKRVLAVDTRAWRNEQACPKTFTTGKNGFNLARAALESNVEDLEVEVPDITVDSVGQFDTVLCLGILYHMKDPFLVLRNLGKVTKDLLVLETHTDANFVQNIPMMVFYPGKELNDDASNWWGPNTYCIYHMLGLAGFKRIELIFKSGFGRSIFHAYKE